MGRILVQNRRPVVTNVAIMSVTDAALTSWFGFSDTTTETMLIGFWVKPRRRNTAYPNAVDKGSYQVSGVQAGISGPNRALYSQLNKAGANTSTSSFLLIQHGWSHYLIRVTRGGGITTYKNGILLNTQLVAGFSNGEHWAVSNNFGVKSTDLICTCSVIFAATDNPDKVLATDEQIRALYETGAIPPDVIYWPMDEGSGSGAGTCKAYVNGVNVPALDGSLNANSWVADSPFN